MVDCLARSDWRGEIVGPHGSGKSTLLAALKSQLADAGRNVSAITLRAGQRGLPRRWLWAALSLSRPFVIVDGFEQLSWLSRVSLKWLCRQRSAGLLVTSHAASGLPLLVELQPDLRLAQRIVSTLVAQNPSRVSRADVAASHACHGSNFREMLFALYDRHEVLARRMNS
jgi:hypothetical protein